MDPWRRATGTETVEACWVGGRDLLGPGWKRPQTTATRHCLLAAGLDASSATTLAIACHLSLRLPAEEAPRSSGVCVTCGDRWLGTGCQQGVPSRRHSDMLKHKAELEELEKAFEGREGGSAAGAEDERHGREREPEAAGGAGQVNAGAPGATCHGQRHLTHLRPLRSRVFLAIMCFTAHHANSWLVMRSPGMVLGWKDLVWYLGQRIQ